jgi:MFS family permease
VSNLGTIVALTALFAVQSAGTAWVGPVAIAVAAASKAFYTPAASAALPNVVDPPDLPAANALGGSAWGTMLVIGASLGGVLTGAFGPYTCFAVALVCLFISALLVFRVRRPMQAERTLPMGKAHPWLAIREALSFIRHQPRVLSLVTVKSAIGLGNGVLAVFPVLGLLFGVGPVGTGLLFAARGLGALIGPLALRRVLSHRSWLLPGLAVSMVVYGVAYLGVSVSQWFWLVLVLATVAHTSGGANWVMSNYALQIEVPDELRGRVFATDMMIATVAISVSLLIAGVLVDLVNPRLPLAICGGLTVVYGITWRVATWRLMRNARSETLPADASVVISPR